MVLQALKKQPLKIRIKNSIYRYKRKKVEKTIVANPHSLSETVQYAKDKYELTETAPADREYIEQIKCLKESLILQYEPELLGEMKDIPVPDFSNEASVKEYLGKINTRSEMIAEMPDSIIPIVMVITGRMMWKHCPKNINGMYGYRTSRSMKNMDTWKFAHDYCGKLWWKIGWVMTIPSALIHIPLYYSNKNTIGFAGLILVAIQCFIMIVSIYPTEKALKKHFNDDGTPR